MGNGQLCSSSHSFWLKIALIRPCGTKRFYSRDKKFRGQCRKGEDVGSLCYIDMSAHHRFFCLFEFEREKQQTLSFSTLGRTPNLGVLQVRVFF
jgi:hypothetical protein